MDKADEKIRAVVYRAWLVDEKQCGGVPHRNKRDKIIELMGDLPRVELFARQAPPGWDVWGNEVLNDVWIE